MRTAAWPTPRALWRLCEHARASQNPCQRSIHALPRSKLAPHGYAKAIRPALPAQAARATAKPTPRILPPCVPHTVDLGQTLGSLDDCMSLEIHSQTVGEWVVRCFIEATLEYS